MSRSSIPLLGALLLCLAASCGSNDTNGFGEPVADGGAPSSTDSSAPVGSHDASAPGDDASAGDDAAAGDDTSAPPPDSGPVGLPDVAVPPNHRVDFNFDIGWKFIKQDVTGADAPAFDDSAWTPVSAPHTYNDGDTYTHNGPSQNDGETGEFTGVTWYRKHFTVPSDYADRKVFLEFEGMRQRATVYLNGTKLGLNETGFVPFGFDLTPNLKFGQDNVIAVQCDSTYPMNAAGSTDLITWHYSHYHPISGGIYRNVYLHVTDKLHVTLPLFLSLQTSGIYVHAANISTVSADLTVEAQIANEYPGAKTADVTAHVLDATGAEVLSLAGSQMLSPGQPATITMSGTLMNPQLWAPATPYLYTVQVTVQDAGQVVDVAEVPLGVRYFAFDKSTGFSINGQPLKLHGWGQKPTNSWAAIGGAVPDWMHEFTMRMEKDANSNFLRWGHCAGSPGNIRMSDKYGLITEQPGVDAEGDTTGAAWKVRSDAFRATITYFRNNPSIFIWEGGNKADLTSDAHIAELRMIKDTLDPTRAFTMRFNSMAGREHYFDVEESAQNGETLLPTQGGKLGVFEGEYNRQESPRRVWDTFSPPTFGYKIPPGMQNPTGYAEDSEVSAATQTMWWATFLKEPWHSGGGNWHFTDEPTHRRVFTDVARNSGEVDAVRLPKESYYAVKAMWSDQPQVHIVGHWTYPANTKKTMYVVSNCDSVELFVNGTSVGKSSSPTNMFLFSFPNVTWSAGSVKAVGTKGGMPAATQEKTTAGAPAAIRLTPTTAPGGWRADGADYAMLDVEVVDANGNRVPTDEARVDFTTTGPGVWMGGYNSGVPSSTGKTFLNTECGINRVFVRSTTMPGAVTVTATRMGLTSGTATVTSMAVDVTGGLSTTMPATY